MNIVEKHHVNWLLCAVILADKKVLNVEVSTFIASVIGIQTALNDPSPSSREDLQFWFEDHFEIIGRSLLAQNWRDSIAVHLEKLKHVRYKWQILQAMKLVAISDKRLHSSEIHIIGFAIEYWGEDWRDYFEFEAQADFSNDAFLEPSRREISASNRSVER